MRIYVLLLLFLAGCASEEKEINNWCLRGVYRPYATFADKVIHVCVHYANEDDPYFEEWCKKHIPLAKKRALDESQTIENIEHLCR